MSRQACNGRLHGRRPDSPGRRIGRSLSPFNRPLRLEALESRRLLAGVVVGNALDVVNGNTVSIANLIADNGGDGISLREAILAANATAGADVITFDSALSDQVITLNGTELAIAEALSIDARPLAQNVRITGNHLSRILNITATTGDFTLGGLTLFWGENWAIGESGAAIYSSTSGSLTLNECHVYDNYSADGGGIYARGNVTLTKSVVTENTATGDGGGVYSLGAVTVENSTVMHNGAGNSGGGIWGQNGITIVESTVNENGAGRTGGGLASYGAVTLTQSTVSGNNARTLSGGGIYAKGAVTLMQSTVRQNRIEGDYVRGGGIDAMGAVTLTQSTVSINSALGMKGASGGGIYSEGAVTLMQSTVSGNTAYGKNPSGGGISAYGAVTLTQSTVSGNRATLPNSFVFDLQIACGIWSYGALTLLHSTVSGNTTSFFYGTGILCYSEVMITQSTVTYNGARNPLPDSVTGIHQVNSSANHPFTISGSIVVNEVGFDRLAKNVRADPESTLTVNHSLIGTGITPTVGGNNIPTDNPGLLPLANNGGPTMTHALLVDSPAIDAGDPTIAFNPATFEQRGMPFARVSGGRIDIGAYERQTLPGSSLVVDSTTDENDGDYSSGHLSLREAIELANLGSIGADTITFAAALSGQTITLGGMELAIREALTIDARPLAANLTINANQQSRVLNITATTGDFALGGLNLIGGRSTASGLPGRGGAVRSISSGSLTIDRSTISGNNTTDDVADGAGVYSKGSLTLSASTISGNHAAGNHADGGALYSLGIVELVRSTISGNTAGAWAGGVWGQYGINVTDSTISGNMANVNGGGLGSYGPVSLTRSTVSGNSTGSNGGGIWTKKEVNLVQSTVTQNTSSSSGGGVFQYSASPTLAFTISGSIVAGNTSGSGGADVSKLVAGLLTVNYSLIGTQVTPTDGGNNVTSNNPQLAPLGDNGGPTLTRAPLAGSPAINAGDPTIGFNSAQFDQRGAPFARVSGGRVDIGAFELQPAPVSADFDSDTDVDGFDFLAWQRGFGLATSAVKTQGNADGDGDVDGADLVVWRAQFGDPPGAFSSGEAALATPGPEQAADAVFASGDLAALLPMPEQRTSFRPRRPWRR